MHRLPASRRTIGVSLFLLVASACGGSDLVLPSEPGVPAAIAVVQGDGQSGSIGSPLPDSIVVKVTDAKGDPVAGQQVAFSLASAAPSAAVTPQTSATGADGKAGARWVLGDTTGPQLVTARVVGNGVPGNLEVTFTASVVPAGADRIDAAGGDAQTGAIGSTLAQPLQVRITTAGGDPRAGVSVVWAAPDGGTVSASSSTTNDQGIAEVLRTLGSTPGVYVTTATAAGTNGSPVTFTSTAVSGAPGSLTLRTQPPSTADAGAELDRRPEVQLRDAAGEDVKLGGVPVTVAIASGNGSLGGTTTRSTDDKGRAEFTDLRIDGAAGAHVLIFAAPGYTSVTSDPIDVRQSTTDQPPAVEDDEYNSIEGHDHTLTVSAADGVLRNDRDPEGGPLTASNASNPPNGSVSLHSDGSFSYTPEPSFWRRSVHLPRQRPGRKFQHRHRGSSR